MARFPGSSDQENVTELTCAFPSGSADDASCVCEIVASQAGTGVIA